MPSNDTCDERRFSLLPQLSVRTAPSVRKSGPTSLSNGGQTLRNQNVADLTQGQIAVRMGPESCKGVGMHDASNRERQSCVKDRRVSGCQ